MIDYNADLFDKDMEKKKLTPFLVTGITCQRVDNRMSNQ